METLTIALWATNLEPPLGSLEDWIARVEARMAEAHTSGAGLLVLPEFACAQWLSFAPPDLGAQNEVPWLGEIAEHALATMRPLPARYNMALLPGTMPFAIPDRGDGKPPEPRLAAAAGWPSLRPGQDRAHAERAEPRRVASHPRHAGKRHPLAGLRVAIIICLDIEFTELFARIAKLDLDLILVPAKVDMLAGYYRVIGSAKARAIELQTVVATVGAVGSPLGQPAVDTVVGAAVVFLPCETSLGSTGVAAALDPLPAATGASPVLYAYHVPLGACRRIRHGAAEAEVWPGSWTAGHLDILDPAQPAN